jgi:uncharacterized protein (DUF3084 family)
MQAKMDAVVAQEAELRARVGALSVEIAALEARHNELLAQQVSLQLTCCELTIQKWRHG